MPKLLNFPLLPQTAFSAIPSTGTSKIIGGMAVSNTQTPWIVAVGYKKDIPRNGGFCGGTLLDAETILTAAHCSAELTPSQVSAVARRSNFMKSQSEEGAIGFQVNKIIIHPKYDNNDDSDSMVPFDFAIWKVKANSGDLSLLPVGMVELDDGQNYANQLLTVSGWGATNPDSDTEGTYSTVLKSTQIPVATDLSCKASFPKITASSFCAGFPTPGNQDSCNGGNISLKADSGGPLFMPASGNRKNVIVGLVSTGNGNCAKELGVYAKVAVVRPWILQNMSKVVGSNSSSSSKVSGVSAVSEVFSRNQQSSSTATLSLSYTTAAIITILLI